jgi:hypothetical protein
MSWMFLKYLVPASNCRQKQEDGGSEEEDQEEGEEGEENHSKVLL